DDSDVAARGGRPTDAGRVQGDLAPARAVRRRGAGKRFSYADRAFRRVPGSRSRDPAGRRTRWLTAPTSRLSTRVRRGELGAKFDSLPPLWRLRTLGELRPTGRDLPGTCHTSHAGTAHVRRSLRRY